MIALVALLIQGVGAAGATAAPDSAAQVAFVRPHAPSMRENLLVTPLYSRPHDLKVPWLSGDPAIRFAPAFARYNRIEAISLAAVAGADVGSKKTLGAIVRLGAADLVPNGEIEFTVHSRDTLRQSRAIANSAATRTLSIAVYHRLSAVNDWGNPLGLGASLGALFIGRDEGFYYRSGGAELRVSDTGAVSLSGRLFVERHRSARVKNDFAIADVFGERRFMPNITATDGDIAGAEIGMEWWRGEFADEPRMFATARVEGAVGDFDYSRLFLDVTGSTPIFGKLLGGLTVAAGTSGGALPIQRAFIIGGTRSARGQRPGVMFGNGFWMSQVELGTLNRTARPSIFFDIGWAGDRKYFLDHPGPIATGAGVGFSFFDGSLRFDLARGLRPGKAWRGALYLEATM